MVIACVVMRLVDGPWLDNPSTGPESTQPSLVLIAVGALSLRITSPVTSFQ